MSDYQSVPPLSEEYTLLDNYLFQIRSRRPLWLEIFRDTEAIRITSQTVLKPKSSVLFILTPKFEIN